MELNNPIAIADQKAIYPSIFTTNNKSTIINEANTANILLGLDFQMKKAK